MRVRGRRAAQTRPRRSPPLQVLQAAVGREVRLIRVADVVFFESDTRYTRVVHGGDGAEAIAHHLGEAFSFDEPAPVEELLHHHLQLGPALATLDQALLAEGGQLEDPTSYVRRVNSLLAAAV